MPAPQLTAELSLTAARPIGRDGYTGSRSSAVPFSRSYNCTDGCVDTLVFCEGPWLWSNEILCKQGRLCEAKCHCGDWAAVCYKNCLKAAEKCRKDCEAEPNKEHCVSECVKKQNQCNFGCQWVQHACNAWAEARYGDTGTGGIGTGETEVPDCIPAQGISPADCEHYQENAWWLPNAYVDNALCACQATPDDPTANCVRKFLQDRLRSSSRYSASLKTEALGMKIALEELQPVAYATWVQARLTPKIYEDHVDAYKACCCPCGPAPYAAWVGVTTIPLGLVSCSAIGESIKEFGPCHCVPGQW